MSKKQNQLTKKSNDPFEIVKRVYTDQNLRSELCRKSHLWFFSVYLPHYIKFEIAEFQRKMFEITEDQNNELAVIVSFRNSAKSTVMTLSYPIWAILGEQNKKCVVILCQTRQQARQHLSNLKRELEYNTLLRADLGPFEENDEEWNSGSIVIPKYDARITALSCEQSFRGLRHGEHRPDLVICDDIEDLDSVRTKESRDKTCDWFIGEVRPIGDRGTKVVVVGNLLHEDSLIKRLEKRIAGGSLTGTFYSFPIVDDNNKPLWPGKYPDIKSIEEERKKIGDDSAWAREFLLKIISDSERVVWPDWIVTYKEDSLPGVDNPRYLKTIIGIDLATSEKERGDYTALITGRVFDDEENIRRLYIDKNVINKRLTLPDLIDLIKNINNTADCKENILFVVENVGFQNSVVQILEREKIPVKGFHPGTQDKRTRLTLVSNLIKTGSVLFNEIDNENLISQITGFGKERHDDMVDALVMVIAEANERYRLGHKHITIPIIKSPMITAGLKDKNF